MSTPAIVQQLMQGTGDETMDMLNAQGLPNAPAGGGMPPTPPTAPKSGKADSGSFFKRMLTNFAYGASQAGLKASGLPTDIEKAQAVTQMRHVNAQTDMIQQQMTMHPLLGADGKPMMTQWGTPVMGTPAQQKQVLDAASKIEASRVRGENAADTTGAYGLQKQGLVNQSKMDVAQLQLAIAQHKGAKYIPDMGADKKPFYHVMNPYGEENGRTDVSTIPALMNKVSTTQDFKQLDDGSIVSIPKTTVSGPQMPGQGAPGGAPGGAGVRPLSDAQGNPIIGKGATTATSRTMVEAAPKVLDFINRIKPLIDQQEQQLGPAAGRWSEFMAGKVGAPNADFTKLRTNVSLLSTLLMRMHAGARGSEYLMKHFSDLMDVAKQSPENLRAAMGEIESYANDVRNSAPLPNYGGVPQTVRNKMNAGKDMGAAPAGKTEGSTGTMPDGTKIIIRGGRIIKQ